MQLSEAYPGVVETVEITLFVPCLNEEKRVVGALETIRDAMAEVECAYEVLVVDDGSTDATVATVQGFIAANPSLPIELYRNPCNRGLSRSFVDAAFRGRGRYYRLVCGDNVEPKDSMIAILRARGKCDIVIPYYPILPGKSRFRKLVSRTYTLIVNGLSGRRLKYYNGCALYRRPHVMRWASYNYGFGFQADLITRLLDEGASYLELPLTGMHLTKDRGSALNLRNFLSTAHTLSEIFLRRVRRMVYGN